MREFAQLPAQWQDLSLAVTHLLRKTLDAQGGWMGFDLFMEKALYTPGLGYYANGLNKIGEAGDFVTAPEVSPLFSYCLANQVFEILQSCETKAILELGAGRGTMAIDQLKFLAETYQCHPHYSILEPSAQLQSLQKAQFAERAPELLGQVSWLTELPTDFSGVILANEVLDAMPVKRYQWTGEQWLEIGVIWDAASQVFQWQTQPISDASALKKAMSLDEESLAPGYTWTWNHFAHPWIQSLSECLTQGVVLLIDYGQEGRSFFHPSRRQDQLACYFQHTKDEDPLDWPGLKDITAHVNFSQIAQAATQTGMKSGLTLEGFTTQANFLIGCGLGELCMQMPEDDLTRFKMAQAIKTLTLPDEMGEDFKVMALSKNINTRLRGFSGKDLRHWL